MGLKKNKIYVSLKQWLNQPAGTVFLLVIIGTFLRFFKLSFQSYWFDEVWNLDAISRGDFLQHLKTGFSGYPPAYAAVLYYWVKLFGDSEFSARALSALLSVLTIPLFYGTVKEFFNTRTARYAALFLTFSAYHVFYAQEARRYSLLYFFSLASTYFFIKWIKSNAIKYSIAYILTSAAAFYAHYSYGLIIFLQSAAFFLFHRVYKNRLIHWLAIQVILCIVLCPWLIISALPLATRVFVHKTELAWVPVPDLYLVIETFTVFMFGHEWVLRKMPQPFTAACKILLCFMGFFLALSYWKTRFQKREAKEGAALLYTYAWCFLPVALAYAVSVFIKSYYITQYLSLSLFACYILLSHSIHAFDNKYATILACGIFLSFNLGALVTYYTVPVKLPVREIARYVESRETHHHAVIVQDEYLVSVFKHYGRNSGGAYYYSAEMDRAASDTDAFWLIVEPPYPESLDYMFKHCRDCDKHAYFQSEMNDFVSLGAFRFRKE